MDLDKYVRRSRDMFTIFAVPKAWNGIDGIRQRNAVTSWTLLDPRPEIIFYYDDLGTKEAAQELGAKYIPDMKRNQWGTPLINEMFEHAQMSAANDLFGYVNSDIILGGNFSRALTLCAETFPQFLMISRRYDIDINTPLDFLSDWERRLWNNIQKHGVLHRTGAIDFFFGRKGLWPKGIIHDFGCGKSAWDNWIVAYTLYRGIPVIEVTKFVMAVHQDIPLGVPTRKEQNLTDERKKNKQMYYDDRKIFGFTGINSEAPWIITEDGKLRKR